MPIAVAVLHAQGVLAGCRGETRDRARAARATASSCWRVIADERGPVFWAARISPVVAPGRPRRRAALLLRGHLLPVPRASAGPAGAGYALVQPRRGVARRRRQRRRPASALEQRARPLPRARRRRGAPASRSTRWATWRARPASSTRVASWLRARRSTLRRAVGDRREIGDDARRPGPARAARRRPREGRELIDEAPGDLRAHRRRARHWSGMPINLGGVRARRRRPRARVRRCSRRPPSRSGQPTVARSARAGRSVRSWPRPRSRSAITSAAERGAARGAALRALRAASGERRRGAAGALVRARGAA